MWCAVRPTDQTILTNMIRTTTNRSDRSKCTLHMPDCRQCYNSDGAQPTTTSLLKCVVLIGFVLCFYFNYFYCLLYVYYVLCLLVLSYIYIIHYEMCMWPHANKARLINIYTHIPLTIRSGLCEQKNRLWKTIGIIIVYGALSRLSEPQSPAMLGLLFYDCNQASAASLQITNPMLRRRKTHPTAKMQSFPVIQTKLCIKPPYHYPGRFS